MQQGKIIRVQNFVCGEPHLQPSPVIFALYPKYTLDRYKSSSTSLSRIHRQRQPVPRRPQQVWSGLQPVLREFKAGSTYEIVIVKLLYHHLLLYSSVTWKTHIKQERR